MKKYIKSAYMDAMDAFDEIGFSTTLWYPDDVANAVLDFKNDMCWCEPCLIVRDQPQNASYTLFYITGHNFVNWDDEFLQTRFQEEVSDFNVLVDYIFTEGVDAEDFNLYFNCERINCSTILEVIQTMAKLCDW